MLNVTGRTLERHADNGLLHPVIARAQHTNRPALYYDPQELKHVPKRGLSNDKLPGEIAARAFEMFEDGTLIRDVVIAQRLDPRDAEDLYQQWLELGGSTLAISVDGCARLSKILGADITSEDRLIECVRDLAARVTAASTAPSEGIAP